MTSLARSSLLSSVIVTSLLLHLAAVTSSCGAGRGYGQRRAGGSRSMAPLVYKQHIPNTPERALSASGPSEGALTRGDAAFKQLAVSESEDVLFKDEEGTGADRTMSHRCAEKLAALALAVRTHWPGVRLRVIDAWIEDSRLRPTDSLHLEGRAVDVATSDRDRTKYGMLARLAVNVGFDWVYYETRGHVHCSVKSDSAAAVRTRGCFPSDATVQVLRDTSPSSSQRRMDQLAVGDRVLVTDDVTGSLHYDVIIGFLHRSATECTRMYRVDTESGRSLHLTPHHLLFAASAINANSSAGVEFKQQRGQLKAVFASRLQAGRHVVYVAANDSALLPDRVIRVTSYISAKGVYAPVTSRGTLIVNDVATSCYALVNSHALAHATMAPLRLAYDVISAVTSRFDCVAWWWAQETDMDGVHWYARLLQAVAWHVLPSDRWFGLSPVS